MLDSKSSMGGLHCSGFAYAWNQKWPHVDIGKYQPCRQIKRSIKNYVPGVVVTDDDHIVLAVQPRRQSRSRSPHPREAADHFPPDTNEKGTQGRNGQSQETNRPNVQADDVSQRVASLESTIQKMMGRDKTIPCAPLRRARLGQAR